MAYTIAVFGLGYVGATSMACLAKLGHRVIGVDIDAAKVGMASRGESPIQEPGVAELLESAHNAGLIGATTNAADAASQSDLCFICVGTPSRPNGSADTTFLRQVIETIAQTRRETERCIPIFVRSTALPAIHQELISLLEVTLQKSQPAAYCVHPEFLREGQGVADFFDPPRIVFGCTDSEVERFCADLYPGIDSKVVQTDPASAALVKYADNCFHAVKVTFGNEIGLLANSFGVDAREVMEIFCLDTKLNISPSYLRPGLPFGGSCLPKDLRGVVSWARQESIALPMLEHVSSSNEAQNQLVIANILRTGAQTIGVIGLAFKDDTDDLRESPMVAMVEHLLGKGRSIKIYDNKLIPDELIGANRRFALDSLPHLESMLVGDCARLVADSELVVIARLGLDVDFAALPWRRDQVVLDLVGLPKDMEIAADVHGLYWPTREGSARLKAVS